MTHYEIIDKKKKKLALSEAEIRFFIRGVTDGTMPDYQVSALLMAICINGMDGGETFFLTDAIKNSGAVTDLSKVKGICADKHSTGGVSDATTLIVVPVLAALGVKVAKLSGRGLGHTGGTLDKLECFPGYNICQSPEEFINIVNTAGAAICGQTGVTAPADKRLYALRDVTATVDSIPLIASSIMGKKLASGADIIMLDVKYGSGAFMKTRERAAELARVMVDIGKRAGKSTAAIITSMEQPLGNCIGGNLEIEGVLEVLGGADNDLAKVSRVLSERIYLMWLSRTSDRPPGAALAAKAKTEVEACIKDGRALKKLKEIVEAHGGSFTGKFEKARFVRIITAGSSGYITKIDTEKLGLINVALGGGRLKQEDVINHRAGIKLKARLNTFVQKGDTLTELYSDDPAAAEGAERACAAAFTITEKPVTPPELIAEI